MPAKLALATCAAVGQVQAQPSEPAVSVSIAAGPLDKALMALAAQTQMRIFFTSDLVAGRRAAPVSGRLTASQALEQLLAGSGLEARRTAPGVLVLRHRPVADAANAPNQELSYMAASVEGGWGPGGAAASRAGRRWPLQGACPGLRGRR